MSTKRWIRFGALAVVGLLLSWLVSCSPSPSGSGSSASGQQEVEFWTMQLQPEFTDYFNDLIADFEAQHPDVTVRWVDVPWADMQSKILTAVSAGQAPDVVNLNPDFASQLASRNAWLELDDRVSAEAKDQYLPNIWQASTLNGASFGFPWYLTTGVSIYNTEILQQAGVSTPPATYEALADAARAIKEKTGKYAYFVTFVPEDSAEVLQSFIQMGVPLVDAQGQAAFNTPAGKAVFEYWTTLFKEGLLPREVLTQGHRRGIELYQAGETAILTSGAEFLRTIETNAPSIAAVSETAPQITGQTGKKNVSVMNLVIPRSTDVPEAAIDFALFVTNNENQLAFAKAANVLPSTRAALQDSHFKQLSGDASPVDKARSVSAQQMDEAEVLIPAMEDIKQLQKIIYENLQAAMLDQKTVDQAIADAEAAWNNR
jgi:putative chitobiose transport system substrate-binding protein